MSSSLIGGTNKISKKMRPIQRIDNFLKILGDEWKKTPDQRFTQFLFNHGIVNMDFQYNMEEYEILQKHFPEIHPRDFIFWGTLGKDGKGPREYKLVKDLDTDHLEAILETQKQLKPQIKKILLEELVRRSKK